MLEPWSQVMTRPILSQPAKGRKESVFLNSGPYRKFFSGLRADMNPASILYKSIAGRYRPVSYPDGPITARYRFIKNADWESGDLSTHKMPAVEFLYCRDQDGDLRNKYVYFNPLESGDPLKGNWQTVQAQVRRRRTRRLIRVSTVCKSLPFFSRTI